MGKGENYHVKCFNYFNAFNCFQFLPAMSSSRSDSPVFLGAKAALPLQHVKVKVKVKVKAKKFTNSNIFLKLVT
jgi:hypothetical protein